MTLILGVLAEGVAHQVGDRLVLAARGAQMKPHDPLANKQVVALARDALVAIGYSGLAYLEGRPTDEILAEAVAGLPLGTGINIVPRNISSIHEIADRIADRLGHAVADDAQFGVDVMMVGLRRGRRRDRLEPLLWDIKKRPARTVALTRHEQTPFNWQKAFTVHAIGDIDPADITSTVADIKALLPPGIGRKEGIPRILVETVRTMARTKKTVGAECMVVRLWYEEGKPIAEVEYRPVTRGRVTIETKDQPAFSFPAAYTPWFLSPGFVASPSIVKGDGGWIFGNIEFRIRAPDAREEGGPIAYFGGQDRPPPPA